MNKDGSSEMLGAKQTRRDTHMLKRNQGEGLMVASTWLAEALGERSTCVTTGTPQGSRVEAYAELFILLIGTSISAVLDLKAIFWSSVDELMQRHRRMSDRHQRVNRYEGQI